MDTEQLYQLLPAIYRIRDAAQGEPLKQLLSVLSTQLDIVESDITQLYDNWFIETCEEWVVPYLGELLGVRGLHPIPNTRFSQRSQVANTLAYRRRKGTATMLEQLARDTTLWNARVVEFFELLATTQYVNHVRLHNLRSPDLRQRDTLDLLDTPFDTIAHTVDVRNIARDRGRHNIPNIGICLWRLQSYELRDVTPRSITDGCYTFTTCGYDAPLFNHPETEETITQLATEVNVPDVIRPAAFYQDLITYRDRYATLPPAQQPANSQYYGTDASIHLIRDGTPIPPLAILCKNLSTWERPPAGRVAIDVRLGRIAFPPGETPANLRVLYYSGFSGDLGGGTYDRRRRRTPADPPDPIDAPSSFDDVIRVSATDVNTITDALTQAQIIWASDASRRIVILIADNRTYSENLTFDLVGAELVVQAANFHRPTIIGSLSVATSDPQARLSLNGLLIAGELTVTSRLAQLQILHSTLIPGRTLDLAGLPQSPAQPSLVIEVPNSTLAIAIDHSIIGSLQVPVELVRLTIRDSIVDSPDRSADPRPALAANATGSQPAPPTEIERTTILGVVFVRELTASEVIFTQPVRVVRRQVGCVRFSYVPPTSSTPRRFRCQPELEVAAQIEQAEKLRGRRLPTAQRTVIRDQVRRQLVPSFTSTRYGQAAYAQLSLKCPIPIRTWAEDGSEMGAFSFLKQPQREANLRASLDEYLRFGLNAGLIFIT